MGRGRSVYKQPGTRVVQVSGRDSGKRGIDKVNQQGELAKGIHKGLRHGFVSSICVYIS
jgi:hypothetical protein